MAEQNQQTDQTPEEGEPHRGYPGKQPDYDAFHVRDGNNGKSYWNRVGIAYKHKDEKGLTIDLDSVPVDGKITLRERAEQIMDQRDKSQQTAPQQAQERNHGPQR
ncbi:hypothetical protein [Aquisalinus luteolus]|uniref:Uncharacterized protein n=1 Tax=Aquisalinus luteolus TaxID=1566827 RepID=A0A8J3A6D4_9PROT|nr:hypothetical protein [Aquisalinus luteolus]GGI00942.1 hypothetical protein GCM10011355_30410 [Aquisalinus luteolus]